MASVELLPGEVLRRPHFPRYPDQNLVHLKVEGTAY
jgi:hypothetical protein